MKTNMKKFSTLILIFSLLSGPSFAAQPELVPSVKLATKALRDIEKGEQTCVYCQAQALAHEEECPEVLKETYQDIYRMGTVGFINKVVSDGALKNPRSACASSAKAIQNVKLADLYKDLQSQYPDSPQLYNVSLKCNVGVEHEKSNVAAAFMTYDFHFKKSAIETALNDLLESKAQLNSMIDGDSLASCHEIGIQSVKAHCLELNACPAKNRNKLFAIKSGELSQTLTALQAINNEYNDLIKKMEREYLTKRTPEMREQLQKIREAKKEIIESALNLNPLLRGEKFKKIISEALPASTYAKASPVNSAEIDSALKSQMVLSQKTINKKITHFADAYKCLTGKRTQCDNYNDIVKESKYQSRDSDTFKKPTLASVATFYNCVESVADSRNEADEVVNESLIGAALTVTPFVVVSGAKLAMTVAKVASVASKAARVEGGVNGANLAASAAYGGYQSQEVYSQCKQHEKEFEDLGAHQKNLSCKNLDNILINKSNSLSCSTQALISAAMLAPLAAPSAFKLAKLMNRPKSPVVTLAGKIRSGKSLTKEEEILLLKKIEESRPLEKLLVKGISPEDSKFAQEALQRLYKQESLSPLELIKLSKLVKPTNPPLLVITQQNNVSAILESARIQGRTEGSVYASTKPIETGWDKFKTGHTGDAEGIFIFTPEAAGLFKPHEIEGLYSGLKRAAGQYKGPFGDIVIEAFEKKIIDGKTFVVITKARKADAAAGEALHDGKRTLLKSETLGNGRIRKNGRRALIEPLAGTSATSMGYSVWSWTTGKDASDFVDEYLTSDDGA